ncbi:hypothetical protein [Sphaerisporangium aureirubrum]|uniref:Uncharacterized protein n=1 Tax=Sphaerisporangium aureirubrum TaxID=1544736 RepID=A0ABW1NQ04_9ACTN
MAEQTSTTNNPFEKQVPTTGVQAWALKARQDLARYIKPLTIRDDVKPYAEAVEKQLVALESAIGVKKTDQSVARAEFITWLLRNDYGGFQFYVDSKDKEILEANRLAAEAAVNKIIASARDAAVQLRNQHGGGSGAAVGTVVSGLADVTTGNTYTGTSGNFAYVTQHAVMLTLLAQTTQVENWPVTGCAEVDAMNNYLHHMNITSVAGIPRGKLFFHAETWNSNSRKWQPRSACSNCDQWIAKIGAGRI